MRRNIFVLISLILAFSLALQAAADVIHMKNKRQIKGVIVGETDDNVTMDMGLVTVTVAKKDIESIERPEGAEKEEFSRTLKKKEIERGTFVPAGLEELADKFKELKEAKKKLDDAKKRLSYLRQDFTQKKDRYNTLLSSFNAKNIEVKNLSPEKNVKYYNKVISDLNSLSIKLTTLAQELNDLSERSPAYGHALRKSIMDYKDTLSDFIVYFERQQEAVKGRKPSEDEALFYRTIKESLAAMEKNLRKDSIMLAKKGNSLIVEVTIDDKVTCVMAVDTGAELVHIAKNVTDRLGIDLSKEREGQFTLADGRTVKEKVVTLKSVKVGSSKVEGVIASVSENPPGAGIDGLLGMSFLDNFAVRVDSANNRLILETIE